MPISVASVVKITTTLMMMMIVMMIMMITKATNDQTFHKDNNNVRITKQ